MTLKLFHITEFAESTLLSPARQREARHPFGLVLLTSLWLVLAANLPLWHEFTHLSGTVPGPSWWLAGIWGLMTVFAVCALLSLLTWRHTLKPALILLLLLAALNTHLMLTQGTFVNASTMDRVQHLTWPEIREFVSGQLLLTLLVLGLLPAALIWRTPVRRIPLLRHALQNAAFLIASSLMLLVLWFASHQALAPLLDQRPPLQQHTNPVNTLQMLGQWLASRSQ